MKENVLVLAVGWEVGGTGWCSRERWVGSSELGAGIGLGGREGVVREGLSNSFSKVEMPPEAGEDDAGVPKGVCVG